MTTDLVLAFDIGGSFLKAAIVDESGALLCEERLALPPERSAAADALLLLAKKLTDGGRSVIGIGMGAPGAIDRAACAISGASGNLPQLVGVQFDELFSEYAVPVLIDNDASNAARGEHLFGAARGIRNALVVTLGTGIGGGLIINGELYAGASSYAGEFGHLIVEARGRRCTCGGYGCVEAYSSAWALRARAADLIRRFPDSRLAAVTGVIQPVDIAAAAACGDTLASMLMLEAATMLGIALASAANLLNPEAIVIGGGVAAAGEVLFRPLREAFRQNALPNAACAIIPAALGNQAGLAGAAALIFQSKKKAES